MTGVSDGEAGRVGRPYVYIYIYTYVHIYTYNYVYLHLHRHICIDIYIYIYSRSHFGSSPGLVLLVWLRVAMARLHQVPSA